jgi:signal transduction histidine kinase
LPAGEYVFEVSACNNGGAWSEAGVPLKLIVHPYFWQTSWFFAATALAGMAGVALTATGISRKRERRKREEMDRQRAREVERTRIARDIHDQLGVGLTRISIISLTAASRAADPKSAQENIAEIHRTTAELTRSMDEIVWAVNPPA